MDEMIRKAATRAFLLLRTRSRDAAKPRRRCLARGLRDARGRRPPPQRFALRVQAHGPCHARHRPARRPECARSADALARGYLRFHAAVPVVVDVAAPSAFGPRSGSRIRDSPPPAPRSRIDDAALDASSARRSPRAGSGSASTASTDAPGALRRLPPSAAGRPPLSGRGHPLADGPTRVDWSRRARAAGRQRGKGACTVRSRRIPAELEGSLLLQPSHDRRHATLLASGTGLEDARAVGGPARPGRHRLRIRPRPRARLDLADGRGRPGQPDPDRPRPVRVGRDRPRIATPTSRGCGWSKGRSDAGPIVPTC